MAQSCIANNGELIKRHIKEKGLTQAEFADKVGCEERTLRKWLRNGVDSISLLVRIANIFECDVDDLFLE